MHATRRTVQPAMRWTGRNGSVRAGPTRPRRSFAMRTESEPRSGRASSMRRDTGHGIGRGHVESVRRSTVEPPGSAARASLRTSTSPRAIDPISIATTSNAPDATTLSAVRASERSLTVGGPRNAHDEHSPEIDACRHDPRRMQRPFGVDPRAPRALAARLAGPNRRERHARPSPERARRGQLHDAPGKTPVGKRAHRARATTGRAGAPPRRWPGEPLDPSRARRDSTSWAADIGGPRD